MMEFVRHSKSVGVLLLLFFLHTLLSTIAQIFRDESNFLRQINLHSFDSRIVF